MTDTNSIFVGSMHVVLVGLFLLMSRAAGAQSVAWLEEVHRYAVDAEFDSALEVIETTLEAQSVSRDELVLALKERILVLHALSNVAALEADLRYLAALDPQSELGRRAPPALVTRWSRAREYTHPLSLQFHAERTDYGYRIRGSLTGREATPGVKLRIFFRAGEAQYRVIEGEQVVLERVTEAPLEYFVQAVGMGDAVLVNAGSSDDPLRLACPACPAVSPRPTVSSDERDESTRRRRRIWLFLGALGIAAVASAVVATLVARSDDNPQQTAIHGQVEF